MRTVTAQDSPVVYASDILIAILVNLKRLCDKKQLFLRAGYNELQEIFYKLLQLDNFKYLETCFVFSDSGPIPYCPILQKAVEHLQFANMLCWPDIQEQAPRTMRLHTDADAWYEKNLNCPGKRLAYQDIITCKQIAKVINEMWPGLIVDRPCLERC